MKKILFLLFINLVVGLIAHPHVFIGVDSKLIFSETHLEKITFHWVFDDMTSCGILEEFDRNGDEKFSESETKGALDIFHEMLGPYDYFIHLTVNDSLKQNIKIENFRISFEDICIAYDFDLNLNIPLEEITNDVKLAVYDPENYVKIVLHKEFAYQVEAPETLKYESTRYINYDVSFYYGQFNPDEYSIKLIKE